MIKNKSNLAIKLFIAVWIVLALHITLKLTFNYWQPYVIPNDTLQVISDYIDSHRWIQATLNGILYFISSIFMILCSIKRWWFKDNKQCIIVITVIILCFMYKLITNDTILNTIFLTIIFPIILDKKKWLYTLLTFALSFVFLFLSLFLEGFVTADNMNYLIRTFLNFDYNIMLILNYFVFNLIVEKKKGVVKNG